MQIPCRKNKFRTPTVNNVPEELSGIKTSQCEYQSRYLIAAGTRVTPRQGLIRKEEGTNVCLGTFYSDMEEKKLCIMYEKSFFSISTSCTFLSSCKCSTICVNNKQLVLLFSVILLKRQRLKVSNYSRRSVMMCSWLGKEIKQQKYNNLPN